VRSIAASEVEGLVLGQVRRLLASPQRAARTITAVRRENAAEDIQLDEDEVIEALGALEPVWTSYTRPSKRGSCGCWSSGFTSRPTASR
jgi:hypothetical protein